MHPEIARELAAQRGREMRAHARQASVARAASRLRRALRHGTGGLDGADELVIPAVPDYVDGSFLTSPAGENAASQPGRVPASRRAA
jgi:hypothetical protein